MKTYQGTMHLRIMAGNYDLSRFHKAQEEHYCTALDEIRSGRKKTHWIWFIFPQIIGLGFSTMCRTYSIRDRGEAIAYMDDAILRHRLVEISRALLEYGTVDPDTILGSPDDLKVKSCMTLFESDFPICSVI